MTSEQYVWAWLPGAADPVVAGRVWRNGDSHLFIYGRSYLDRENSIPLFGVPLDDRPISPPIGMTLHGALRDALPDAWGQHVILNRITGRSGVDGDTGDLGAITYMKESGSDRFGAIDFQDGPFTYVPRREGATLDELAEAAAAIEEGRPLPPALDAALNHGTTVGGARPKATLMDSDGVGWIAKFSSASDRGNPVVRHESLALDLARLSGVDVVDSALGVAGGRDALLVRRFDRGPLGTRSMAVSGLTLLELDEMVARYATYPDLLDKFQNHSNDPDGVADQLFRRIAVNIALGNTDDHARNHAALWDGQELVLSPAYDLDPCRSPGWDANQAMAYGRHGERASDLAALVGVSQVYRMNRVQAHEVIDQVISAIEVSWDDAVDRAGLTRSQGAALRGSRILNPATTAGLLSRSTKYGSSKPGPARD